MMATYSTPIIIAAIVLTLLGFFIAVPWLIYNYRKYGFLSVWMTFVVFSFVFYILSAYFLVILPLPDVRQNCAMQDPNLLHYQLMPFYFLYEMIQGSPVAWSKPTTYIHLLRHPSFLPAFFNVLILLPLGVYMRYFRGKTMRVIHMLGLGFLVSLFFEVTQLTGLYGIYECPYRTFNVDDLILNTTGAVLGFIIAPIILAIVPSREQVEEKAKRVFEEATVRPLAQLLAIFIDYVIVVVLWLIVSTFVKVDDPLLKVMFIFGGLFMVQYIVPLFTQGVTPGTKVFRFHLAPMSAEKPWRKALFQRWVALMFPWVSYQIFSLVVRYSTLDMDSPYYTFRVLFEVSMFLVMVLITLIFMIHAFIVVINRGKKQFYFDHIAKIHALYRRDS